MSFLSQINNLEICFRGGEIMAYDFEETDWIEQEMNAEDECYYGMDFCIDSFCRDVESCLGCSVITPDFEFELAFTPFD
jgi:hypothetical protein